MGGVTWRGLGLGLGLLMATVGRAEPVAPTMPLEPPPRAPIVDVVEVSARWASDVRFGISAGNVLLGPFVVPGPGASTALSGRFRFFRHFTVGGDVATTFGLQTDNSDPAPIVGYRGRLRLGLTGDIGALTLAADLRGGVSSVALFPLPRYGLGGSLSWRPVDLGWLAWDLRADADLELLVIAPSPGFGASTGLTFQFGWFEGGFRLAVDADAVLAVVVNTVGAAGSVQAFIGARF